LISIVLALFGINSYEVLAILGLHGAQEVPVFLQPALYIGVSVLFLLEETGMCLLGYLLGEKVVGLAFYWVKAALLDLLVDRGVALVHGDHQGGDNT
jgi:hypothetical protein